MITGDHTWLENIAKYNVCSEHKTPLEVAWHSGEKVWVLRCGHDHYPDAVTRQLSLTQEYKAGEEIPEPIKSNIEKSMRRRAMAEGKQPQVNELAGVPQTDLGTGELLFPEVIRALVEYAKRYRLDAKRGHVVLMYGKPYFTIDGYLFYARQTRVAYSLNARPMTTEEEKQYKIQPTDHAWLAEVVFALAGAKFTGVGIVTYDEMTAKSSRDETKLRSPVVAKHPWQLAQKRAEWQALRRAFPIGESPEARPEGAPGQPQDGG